MMSDSYNYHPLDSYLEEEDTLDWWSSTDSTIEQDEEENESNNNNMLDRMLTRFLKKKGEYQRPDYSVLSVTVMTLGLIIMVEFVKHKIDHMAHGKRYFTAVLHTFYSELTILGMVEFLVWLIQEYHENMNKDKKQVFAQVHFALFYTAIFNALQSVVLYHIVRRLSKKIWIQTEALELNHYVEIREEFEAVSAKLKQKKSKTSSAITSASEGNANGATSSSDDGSEDDEEAEWAFEFNWSGIEFMWHSLLENLRHPNLSKRYHELLVQVRFHELRVHFVEAYNLPSNFRISDYLVRSEEAVLMKLLHVTTYAWLFLTASVNLLYYILGIAVTETGDLELPGTVLIYVYFISIAVFLVIALLLYNKMKLVFKNIMHRNHLWENIESTTAQQQGNRLNHHYDSDEDEYHDVDDEDFNHMYYSSRKEALEAEQLSLFWASSPKLIITAIQSMQFGYAVALSVVIIFWTEINDADIHMAWYLVVIFLAYGAFIGICAQAVPRYTLCTSLGQLVDKKRLQETVSIHRLNEARKSAAQAKAASLAKHSQQPTLEFSNHGSPGKNDDDDPLSQSVHDGGAGALGTAIVGKDREVPSSALSLSKKQGSSRLYGGRKSPSEATAATRSTVHHTSIAGDLASVGGSSVRSAGSKDSNSDRIAMLVRMDTKTLRSLLPRDELEKLSQRDELKKKKLGVAGSVGRDVGGATTTSSGRQKASSSGVAAMSGIKKQESKVPEWPSQQQLQSLASADPVSSRSFKEHADEASDRLSPLDTMPENLRARRIRERRQRRPRQKSVSDGVAMMSAMSAAHASGGGEEEETMETSDVQDMSMIEPVPAPPAVPKEILPAPPQVSPVSHDTSMTKQIMLSQQVSPTTSHDDEFVDDIPTNGLYNQQQPPHHHSADEVVSTEIVEYKKPEAPKPTFLERCRKYYKSKKYVVVSNVFGTMFAFFLVATRVERFLHTENIVPSGKFVSFQFDQRASFWLLSTWMYLFIINDSLLFLSLPGYKSLRRFRDRRVWVAGLLDMAIVYACIMVFNIAEAHRCCDPTDDELSAAYDTDSQSGVSSYTQKAETYDTKDAAYDKKDDYGAKSYTIGYDPHPCDCPVFGSRLYGGLGDIEPYVSLIALRLFRFWVAGLIVRFLDGKHGKKMSKSERVDRMEDRKRLDPMDIHGDEHGHEDGHGDDHGHGGHGHHEESGTAAQLWEAAMQDHPEIVAKYGEFSREMLLAMLNIPIVEEQEKPKLKHDASITRRSSSSLEIEANDKHSIVKAASKITKASNKSSAKTVPAVVSTQDDAEMQLEKHEDKSSLFFKSNDSKLALSNFVEPDAPLVLSMHRCERKVLPILDTWCTVDVVMTPFEMVYFDVSSDKSESTNAVVEGAIRQALISTKGGKGLSLCAVASIRRVVGHVRFSDVTALAVERTHAVAPSAAARAVASECIQIRTADEHTLCLKFYSAMAEPRVNNNGSIDQWVDMIRRHCQLELSPSLDVSAYTPDSDDESDVSV